MAGTKDDIDVDDDVDVDDVVDDEPDNDKPDPDAKPEPYVKEDGSAFTAADFAALSEALRKARKEARDAKRGKASPPDSDDDKSDDGTKAAEAARLKAEAETIAKWKPLVVNNAARSALTTAGLIGSPDRLLRLLDLDEIDVDSETGEIDGLTEQVTDLKKDYPHLFRKRGGGSINAADRSRQSGGRDKRTPSQIQADMLLGKGDDD